MNVTQMKHRLLERFPGAEIEVQDLTGTEDHYEVLIRHPSFENATRMARHRMVMAAFSAELATGEVHALTIKAEPT